MTPEERNKEVTGGGCSICGSYPTADVGYDYWLCWPCVKERFWDGVKFIVKYIFSKKVKPC